MSVASAPFSRCPPAIIRASPRQRRLATFVPRAVATQPSVFQWPTVRGPRLEGRLAVEDTIVRAHEVGPNHMSGIVTISNMLQECASNSIVSWRGRSEQYFAADPELAKLDLIFVATRMQIRMQRYPRWGDVVRLTTYFQNEGRVGARRDWRLVDVATGEPFGCATSSWVLINYRTRRLGRMPEAMRKSYESLMPDPPLHCIPAAETRLRLPEVDMTDTTTASGRHTATPLDMDMNNHVNNTAFLTWVLSSMPVELQLRGHIEQYEVEYKAEAVAGDEIVVNSRELHDSDPVPGLGVARTFVTSLCKELPDGTLTEILRARTSWANL